jgi:UMF1 family MFS transporter
VKPRHRDDPVTPSLPRVQAIARCTAMSVPPGPAPTSLESAPSTVAEFPPVKRSEIFGWCCFDFANSAFTTIIITVFYAKYFVEHVAGNSPLATGWWGTAISFSQFVVIFLSPLIGAVADLTARKKTFLMITALACSIGTMALYFIGRGEIWLALGIVCAANIAFSLSENLCAAFLPEISTPANVGKISGYGWSFGYFGGLFSLALALMITRSGPNREPWTFVMTGAFFILASLPTLLLVRERTVRRTLPPDQGYLSLGFAQLKQMIQHVPQHRTLAIFFVAMTLYMSGLLAVVTFAVIYASAEIRMTQDQIIVLFILLQVAAAGGAFGFGLLQDRVGSKPALILSLLLWIAASIWGAVCRDPNEFFYVGVLAGIAIGSLQSAGRAVVSSLTPPGRAGEFFGYWGFFGKLAGVIGPFVFGWLASYAGNRTAMLANGGFFVAGLLVILAVRLAPGSRSNQ